MPTLRFDIERLVPLRDVPRLLPVRPNGRRTHLSVIYRWTSSGVAGVVLESIRIGGSTYTSVEALQRFAERLSSRNRAAEIPPSTTGGRDPSLTARRVAAELGIRNDRRPELRTYRPGNAPC
ncbi:MAG: DUF1580 domain-containing protein [Bdellovibrionota bacterium]|nr:MAG: DUF1580 domain-containing protein [Bdellovibrionota bacterium]